MRGHTDFALYRRLLRQVRPYWPHLGGILLLSLLSSPLALLTPLPLKIVVDSVIGSHPLPGFLDALVPGTAARSDAAVLVFAVGLIIVVALLRELLRLAGSLLRMYAGTKLVLHFRAQLFHHAQRLSLLYHDSKGTSDSAYRIQYDAPAIRWITIDAIPPLATAVVTLVGMICVTFMLDWQLALVALTVSPIFFLITRFYGRPLRKRWRKVQQLDSSALSVIHEVLSTLRVVKAFGQETREGRRFLLRSRETMRQRIRVTFAQGTFAASVGLITAVGTAAVLFVGVRNVQAGILTLGDLLLVMGYLAQLYGPLNTLSHSNATLQSSLASSERAFSLLDEAPDVVEQPNARPLSRTSGAVAFHDVSFSYREDHPVLHDISFEVAPGTRLGISGTTGAGKSTLVNLLIRFYDPTAGQILLDGVDLRDYKTADLRNQFAIVLQEPVLLSTSIAENIAYARPNASEGEIVESAKAAGAHKFIVNLPRGYETRVGERGMSLSGGERQRIALARAFLKDARILILDEPTSSVDTKTEAAIMEAMERLMHGRTTFMIAHRLGTLANCDVRLEIEDGCIVRFDQQPPPITGVGARDLPGLSSVALSQQGLAQASSSRPAEAARLFRDVACRQWDVDLGYTLECLPLLEHILMTDMDATRENPQVLDALVTGLGCFLGEAIRRNARLTGSWRPAEDWSEGPIVEFAKLAVDPIGKARAFLHEGPGDSVAFYADYVLRQLDGYTGEGATELLHQLKEVP
jgi:ATP-binding cassette subfamily B protein